VQKSLAATFFERANSLGSLPAVRVKEGRESYTDVCWTEYGQLVSELAFGLAALGLEPKQCTAIFASNSHLWVASDFATISNGAISVPIYPTSSKADIEFILANSESKFIFVQNDKLLAKVLGVREQLPYLKKIVVFNLPESTSAAQVAVKLGLEQTVSNDLMLSIEELCASGRDYAKQNPQLIEQRISATDPSDTVTVIYTSGTTGTPKGASLTHRNILAVLNDLPGLLPISGADIYLSYLPMSHVFERVCGEFYQTLYGGVLAFAESIETMAKNLGEVEPTMILTVPRVLDRIHAKVKSGMDGASGKAKKLLDWALYVGKEALRTRARGKQLSVGLRAKLWLAEKLVFRKMRQRIAPKLRLIVSGGAPATPHVIEFFNTIGISTLEGYGLTETSAPASVNLAHKVKIGSVGPVLPSIKVRIAEDGEILLRGNSIFSSYYKNEEATRDAFDQGWFKTGDSGVLDQDGYLRITDRKKDLIVNAAGKNIAPQRIEALIKTVPFITQAVVFGDRQKHLVALLTLDENAVIEFAREQNWTFENYGDLVVNLELVQYITKEFKLRSGQLADYEQVRRFSILAQDLSVDQGELTATLKIKRNVIAKKYESLIQSLFKDEKRAMDHEGARNTSSSNLEAKSTRR
jgi:long-chain acyl-CoA synthetase